MQRTPAGAPQGAPAGGLVVLLEMISGVGQGAAEEQIHVAAATTAVSARHYLAFQKKQLNVSELAKVCDLSRTTVYKYIEMIEGKKNRVLVCTLFSSNKCFRC